jgi:hypothetical protein
MSCISGCPLSFETGGTMGYNCCFFLNFLPLHIESPYNFGGKKNPLRRVNGHAIYWTNFGSSNPSRFSTNICISSMLWPLGFLFVFVVVCFIEWVALLYYDIYWTKCCVIKLVSHMHQIGGFSEYSNIPLSFTNKTDCHDITEISWIVGFNNLSV